MNRAMRRAEAAGLEKMMERESRIRQQMQRAGAWPDWEVTDVKPGEIRGLGWSLEIVKAYRNTLFAVLYREIETRDGRMVHLAMRDFNGGEIPWRDKMRIKDELVGFERHAVEVFPARSQLVDDANMYHLWVYPEGYQPSFTLVVKVTL